MNLHRMLPVELVIKDLFQTDHLFAINDRKQRRLFE